MRQLLHPLALLHKFLSTSLQAVCIGKRGLVVVIVVVVDGVVVVDAMVVVVVLLGKPSDRVGQSAYCLTQIPSTRPGVHSP